MMSHQVTIKFLIIVGFALLSLGFVTTVLANTPPPSQIAPSPIQFENMVSNTQPITTTFEAPRGVLIFEGDIEPQAVQLQSSNTLTMSLIPGETSTKQFNYCNSKSNPNNTTSDLIWSIKETFPIAGAEWLVSIAPTGGTIPAPPPGQLQNCQTLTATFDATDLEGREQPYTTAVTFDNAKPDGDLPDVVLNVELTVSEGVSIELRAFIPCEAIAVNAELFGLDFPVMFFAGDGYSMQTFRALQQVTVDAPPDDTPPNDLIINGPNRFWGESKRYKGSQVERATNRPSWCWKFREGEQDDPWYTATLHVTESNNRVRVDQYSLIRETFVDLYINGGNPAANPGVPFPEVVIPNLDANIRVEIRKHNGEYQYKLRGAHDGFPAYYLYINGIRVHCYDPLEEGGSPWYLGGGLDITINDFENWNSVSNAQDCDRPLGVRLSYPEIGVGGSTTLTGISFPPHSGVSIHINDNFMRNITADETGKFRVILNTPSTDEGIYNISVGIISSSMSSQSTVVEPVSARLTVSKSSYIYEKDDGISVEISIPDGIAEPWSNFLPIIIKSF